MRTPLVAAVVTALALAGCGDDEPSATDQRAEQVAAAARDAGLADDVADVLALAARGVDGTFRVTYEVADPEGGPPQRVTATQRPPNRRIDIVGADGATESTIAISGSSYQCSSTDPATAPWSCERLADDADPGGGRFDPTAIDALVASLTAGAADYDFTVEARSLAGVDATCLVTRRHADAPADPAAGAEATLCLSAEGARLLTELPSGTLRAVEYGTDVSDDAFTLPAEPGTLPAEPGTVTTAPGDAPAQPGG